ncbi:carbon-nitrogen hydrolase [Punctularia strigosozonata HHB-11173 SS5]|uniref:carbon-nitrogen hydrolase n=1 Tax=Punctularia strigosozonata (strain HHB-11173) TaxID=741275 RepID=UPI0004416276|nr:carbon-nitrogen hydrolase [Punctularia strigosozonata HHB-11173 SS5]EIN10914.1 carbon-nitrogen hydrolase [Punctularia strigosozonata HHB-11173 SS5]
MPDSTPKDSGGVTSKSACAAPQHRLKCGVVQFAPDKSQGATAANLERMLGYIQRGQELGVQLLVFPELGTCGYDVDESAVVAATESSSLVVETISSAAKDAGMRIVVSYPSTSFLTGKRHITASSFSPTGDLEITYHKTHPWAASTFENVHFTLGQHFCDSVPVENALDAFVNVLICWDIEFPEPARVLRLKTPGEHHYSPLLICVPTANADASIHEYTLRTRAVENHCFILYANNATDAFSGGSCVVGPDGQVLTIADGTAEEMVIAEVDLSRERYQAKIKVNPMLEWRRPELYGALCETEKWDKPTSAD